MDKKEFVKRKKREIQKDKKSFVKEFKKSYDYLDHGVGISAADQAYAEKTIDPRFFSVIKEQFAELESKGIASCKFEKGQLTLSKKDRNLYNGHFEDADGQIIEKYQDKTLELITKDLMVKNLILNPAFAEQEEHLSQAEEEIQDEPILEPKTFIKLRCGDFELELRKSLENAMTSKSSRDDLAKSLRIFRKSTKTYTNARNDKETIKELLSNWDIHSERFNQILFAVEQAKKAKK